jgi:hypothetical protein
MSLLTPSLIAKERFERERKALEALRVAYQEQRLHVQIAYSEWQCIEECFRNERDDATGLIRRVRVDKDSPSSLELTESNI